MGRRRLGGSPWFYETSINFQPHSHVFHCNQLCFGGTFSPRFGAKQAPGPHHGAHPGLCRGDKCCPQGRDVGVESLPYTGFRTPFIGLAPGHEAVASWNGLLLPKSLNCQCVALALVFLLTWKPVRISSLFSSSMENVPSNLDSSPGSSRMFLSCFVGLNSSVITVCCPRGNELLGLHRSSLSAFLGHPKACPTLSSEAWGLASKATVLSITSPFPLMLLCSTHAFECLMSILSASTPLCCGSAWAGCSWSSLLPPITCSSLSCLMFWEPKAQSISRMRPCNELLPYWHGDCHYNRGSLSAAGTRWVLSGPLQTKGSAQKKRVSLCSYHFCFLTARKCHCRPLQGLILLFLPIHPCHRAFGKGGNAAPAAATPELPSNTPQAVPSPWIMLQHPSGVRCGGSSVLGDRRCT